MFSVSCHHSPVLSSSYTRSPSALYFGCERHMNSSSAKGLARSVAAWARMLRIVTYFQPISKWYSTCFDWVTSTCFCVIPSDGGTRYRSVLLYPSFGALVSRMFFSSSQDALQGVFTAMLSLWNLKIRIKTNRNQYQASNQPAHGISLTSWQSQFGYEFQKPRFYHS